MSETEDSMRLKTLIIIGMIFISADCFAANSNIGKSAYPFLKIGMSAKAQAMGGAFAGLADDISSLYYNPAGLAAPVYSFYSARKLDADEYGEDEQASSATATIMPRMTNRFMATYLNYLMDFQSGYIAYARFLNEQSAAGAAITYQNYGTFKRLDRQGAELGDFGAYDLALGLTYSKYFIPNLSLGVTGKLIVENIDTSSSFGLALDLGGLYRLDDGRTGFGLSATNLGVQLKGLSKSHKDPLPLTIDGGFTHHLRGMPLTFSGDIIYPTDNDIYFALGGQFEAFRPFMLRLGWSLAGRDNKTGSSKDGLAGFAGGFGYSYKEYTFDYAYSSYADIGNVHRLTLSVEF